MGKSNHFFLDTCMCALGAKFFAVSMSQCLVSAPFLDCLNLLPRLPLIGRPAYIPEVIQFLGNRL